MAQTRTVLKPRSTASAKARSRSAKGSPGPACVYQLKSHRVMASRSVWACRCEVMGATLTHNSLIMNNP